MNAQLTAQVPQDGALVLAWSQDFSARNHDLLIMRTGAVPAFTFLQLDGKTQRYEFNNLSRHQRYRVAVLAHGAQQSAASPWLSITPRQGLEPRVEEGSDGIERHVARITRLTLMPQDQRITAYWQRAAGFAEKLILQVHHHNKLLKSVELEPEVNSICLTAERGFSLKNGETYSVRLRTRFAGMLQDGPEEVRCIPAPDTQERHANQSLPQQHLIYPCLSLSPELRIFDDDPECVTPADAQTRSILCIHCRGAVQWRSYHLRCQGCGAQFIPTGRGDYLDVAQLRFGTCRCCLPHKILIQKKGSDALVCAHSGKEHIRLPGAPEFHLIEDLPFGLCQCCRPRRPLEQHGKDICCSKTREKHRSEQGRYVLIPSQPVFDATAIDELLDAGLAEICSTGVSRARS